MTSPAVPPPSTAPISSPGTAPPSGFWSLWLLGGCTGLILLVIAVATAGVILNLREAALRQAETTVRNLSVVLAEQADRSLQALDLVLSGVVETLPQKGVTSPESYVRAMDTARVHQQLQDKMAGLPYVNAITLIAANGNLINFTRAWPIPKVNVADRDYFQIMRADPKLVRFISVPVPNRGDGTWTVYLAHQVRTANGSFVGLVLGAIELRYYEDLYRTVSASPHGSIVLHRDDGVLLVRYPPSAAVPIGRVVANGALQALHGGNAGVVREVSPFDGEMRIKAAQRLANFPLVVVATEAEADVLATWRSTAWVLGVVALFCGGSIVVAALAIARWWRHQQVLGWERAERADADRALALAETDLLRERELAAERVSGAKSEFLASMSHEIRTPLNAVLGLAGLLLDGELSDAQRKLVRTIHESGESLLLILNDILDFSKLDAGRMQFEAISFSPATLTAGVVSILFSHAATKGLDLRTEIDPALPVALAGDAGRIRQVLLNLASNAVKFTASGRVSVCARVCARGADDATIEWAVQDTGIGIAPDRVESLFSAFVQADASITRRFGGSGLGLAICKRLVEQMGGAIGLESATGQGSVFRFHLTLKLAEPVQAGADPQDGAAALDARIAHLGRRLRVLFAEDNPTNQFVAQQLLKGFAAQVDIAGNGLEAVAAASRVTYDLICMDVSMPDMDGLAATRTIRALPAPACRVPIIALTANAFPEDVAACLSAGMDHFVAKPVSRQGLVAAILRVIDGVAPSGLAPGLSGLESACDDIALAALIQDLGEATVGELVRLFTRETQSRLRRLASMGPDPARLAREFHALKGAAGTVCAPQLADLAGELEARSGTGAIIGANDMTGLAAAFGMYCAAVSELIPLEHAEA